MVRIREIIWTIASIIIISLYGIETSLMFLAYTFRFYFGFVLFIAFFIALLLAICFVLILIRRGRKYFWGDDGKNMKRIKQNLWTFAAILIIWQFGLSRLFYRFFFLGAPIGHFFVFVVFLLFIASIIAVFRVPKKRESG